jgi:hypothetical protein
MPAAFESVRFGVARDRQETGFLPDVTSIVAAVQDQDRLLDLAELAAEIDIPERAHRTRERGEIDAR